MSSTPSPRKKNPYATRSATQKAASGEETTSDETTTSSSSPSIKRPIQQQQPQPPPNGQQNVVVPSESSSTENDSTPRKRQKNNNNDNANDNNKDNDNDDDDIEIISPPPRHLTPPTPALLVNQDSSSGAGAALPSQTTTTNSSSSSPATTTNHHQDDNDDDDAGVLVAWSNVTNPNIHYPHKRIHCGVYKFDPVQPSMDKCDKCYCVVCDTPASQCQQWKDHCGATHKSNKPVHKPITINPYATTTNTPSRASSNSSSSSMHNRFQEARLRNLQTERRVANPFLDMDMDSDDDWTSVRYREGNSRNPDRPRERRQEDMRITEILSLKLRQAVLGEKQENDDDYDEHRGMVRPRTLATTPTRPLSASHPLFSNTNKMQGDLESLCLKSIFVEGIKIGWPFATILPPQRQMMIHIIKALKRKLHVVLESPTGTGKSAAILCAVLAWQRYQLQTTVTANKSTTTTSSSAASAATVSAKADEKSKAKSTAKDVQDGPMERPITDFMERKEPRQDESITTIIYCSRTHSQVAQMVASLKKTPYRPRMCVLGSRDRLCIHPELVGPNKKNNGVNLNQSCRDRKRNTDKQRKSLYKSHEFHYNDDHPPSEDMLPRERDDGGWDMAPPALQTTTTATTTMENANDDDDSDSHNDDDDDDMIGTTTTANSGNRRKKPTCPHYRQLSSWRTARMTKNRFVWDAEQAQGCCSGGSGGCSNSSNGGEHTTMGVHDLEDLVKFGKNPYKQDKIVLYNHPPSQDPTFGLSFKNRKKQQPQQESGPDTSTTTTDGGGGCLVQSLLPYGIAEKDGRLREGDWIVGINGMDTRDWNSTRMSEYIRGQQQVTFSVQHQAPKRLRNMVNDDIDEYDEEEEEYSDHAACPYFLSRALLPHANLVFCPYNYVLDPGIRSSLGITLQDAVVVIDEAHNVEDTLCESGSGEFGEFNLYHLVSVLALYSNRFKGRASDRDQATLELPESNLSLPVPEVAHDLLLFVEKLVLHMRGLREKFESSPGLEQVKREHAKFKLPDDKAVEVTYKGPTGFGFQGQAIGCKPLLEQFGITSDVCTKLLERAQALETHLFGGDQEERDVADPEDYAASSSIFNDLISVLSRLELASKNPEHFYMACVMKPNGNIDYATGRDEEEYSALMARQAWRKQPKPVACVPPRTRESPNIPLDVCNHKGCNAKNERGYFIGDTVIRHGDYCKGELPRWECHLVLRLLSPGLLMRELSEECRSVILASGSLAPLPSLCAELNLYPPKKEPTAPNVPLSQAGKPNPLSPGAKGQVTPATKTPLALRSPNSPVVINLAHSPTPPVVRGFSQSLASPSKSNENKLTGRLQVTPKPLEANHVINLPKQLYAAAIGHFPDGSPLTVTYSNYKQPAFFPKLGNAIATVIEAVPSCGVLVFFPSYTFLKNCVKCWNPSLEDMAYNRNSSPQIWNRFKQSKGEVIVEPTGSQAKFEKARLEYKNQIDSNGNCILLAVFRGKMSEGISFNDDNARCVICVGLPYPNSFDRNVKAKMSYNDEQRKIRKNNNLLPGQEWYMQQAYRAISQALGRCIRHGADYGSIILMDSRNCDDGSPNDGICRAHKNLPKWMRHHIRTLSKRPTHGVGRNPILGSYAGMRQELVSFFQQAPIHSRSVLDKWKTDLQAAQARSAESNGHTFDRQTGKWTAGSDQGTKPPGNVKAET